MFGPLILREDMRGPWVSWLMLVTMALSGATMARAQPAPEGVDPGLISGERPVPRDRDAERRATPTVEVERAPPSTPGPTSQSIQVGAITLSGLERLTPADFTDILTNSIGRRFSPKALYGLTNAIANRMRARGYVFATATIAPQRMTAGVLIVTVDEGRIDEVRFDGPVSKAVQSDLAPLAGAGPVTKGEVERRLLLAGDNSGTRIRSSKFFREGGRGILLVSASHDPATVRMALTNQGTRTIGPVQLRIDADLNGLIDSRDRLSISVTGTPAQPSELQFGRIRYARDLNSEGTEIALSATGSATRPGSYLAPLGFRSRSWAVGASLTQPLLRRRAASFWLEGELGLRSFRQWRTDTLVRYDRLSTARLTVYGNAKIAGGLWRVSAGVTQGLGWLGTTAPGDPLATRSDADGTYTVFSLWSDWTADLGHGLSLRLAGQGQLAAQPLPLSEEMALGGTAFLRGYDWGERSGDRGVAGLAELRYLIDQPLGLVRRAQVYAFADGGVVSNLQGGSGGGSLASAGGGLRIDLTPRMGTTVEVAVPLSGPRYDTGTQSAKINLGLIRSF